MQLLVDRANATYYNSPTLGAVKECDLIAKGVVDGVQRGWVHVGGQSFQSDSEGESSWTKNQLIAEAQEPGQAVTFTCVPPGSGTRMGIDRDADSLLDGRDSVNCSAVRVDGSQRAHLALLGFMTLVGLLFLRRRRTV